MKCAECDLEALMTVERLTTEYGYTPDQAAFTASGLCASCHFGNELKFRGQVAALGSAPREKE